MNILPDRGHIYIQTHRRHTHLFPQGMHVHTHPHMYTSTYLVTLSHGRTLSQVPQTFSHLRAVTPTYIFLKKKKKKKGQFWEAYILGKLCTTEPTHLLPSLCILNLHTAIHMFN